MSEESPLQKLVRSVEDIGVSVELEAHRFSMYNVDMSFPFVIITLCLRGSARALYDMRALCGGTGQTSDTYESDLDGQASGLPYRLCRIILFLPLFQAGGRYNGERL